MNVDQVHTVFVIPEGCEDELQTSRILQDAFLVAKKLTPKVQWIREQDCDEIDLQKTVFLVFEVFQGSFYEKAVKSRCAIIGPWCLLKCNACVKSIPNVSWPILNMALDGCIIVCSNLSKTVKNDIKNKVQLMGGRFSAELVKTNTHLVTASVRSEKYNQAVKCGLKIMLPSWVEAVWEASLLKDVNLDEFQTYKCLAFNNLTICSTGFTDNNDKKKLQTLITTNGGNFSLQLNLKLTQILVCNGTSSAKYNAARKHKIDCVTPEWIYDSASQGFAIPEIKNYQVKKSTSTPSKTAPQFDPNFSTISAIGGPSSGVSVLQETLNATNFIREPITPKRPNPIKMEQLETLDIKRVKMAGPFLDGCSIYLAGFPTDQREKIIRVLNFSGANRYDVLSDRITHVVVGDSSSHECKALQLKNVHCPIVSFQWILDSMEKQLPIAEENYLISTTNSPILETGSPLSKKGLSLLRANTSVLELDKTNFVLPPSAAVEPEEDLMKQYLDPGKYGVRDTFAAFDSTMKPENEISKHKSTLAAVAHAFDGTMENAMPEKEVSNNKNSMKPLENQMSTVNENTSRSISVTMDSPFDNLKFRVIHFTDEEESNIRDHIEDLGGQVVTKSYKGITNYTVVPKFSSQLRYRDTQIVTDIWISECLEKQTLLEINYYHQTIQVDNKDTLSNCVITLSNYVTFERLFLKELILELGGTSQDSLSRISRTDKNVKTSTHLICSEDSGKKYEAAVRWSLPVVNKDWLLECARTGQLVDETLYMVGAYNIENRKETQFQTPVSLKKRKTSISPKQVSNMSQAGTALNISINSSQKLEHLSDDGTPVRTNMNKTCETPENQNLNCSAICSQITPVNQIMQRAISNNFDMDFPKTPKPWDFVETPDTPLGAFIRPNPSPELRKKFQRWIDGFPDTKPERRLSTPMSELKKRLWNKVCPNYNPSGATENQVEMNEQSVDDNVFEENRPDLENEENTLKGDDETRQNAMVSERLVQLHTMLSASGGSRRSSLKLIPVPVEANHIKESQVFSVGWDDDLPTTNVKETHIEKQQALFMISGTDPDERTEFVGILESLGASVSDLSNYDPASTHLVCPKLSRNEKILASMAAGKWILHTSYVEDSLKAGKLLDEEDYEYGNPRSKNRIKLDKESEIRAASAHYWRKEISRRGYAAFHDVKAIIIAARREPIVRVIEAGGGMVVDASPPFEENLYATHCLIEIKHLSNCNDYIPLANEGILCIQTLYVNDFLHRTLKDLKEYIIPGLTKHYSSMQSFG